MGFQVFFIDTFILMLGDRRILSTARSDQNRNRVALSVDLLIQRTPSISPPQPEPEFLHDRASTSSTNQVSLAALRIIDSLLPRLIPMTN